ncbi:MAG: aminopeptidase N [Hyphomicrobiaceae bacterium]
MSQDRPRVIRLADYAPSPYLVDAIELDIQLHPTRTKVHSTLKVRPNPASPLKRAALRLDGEAIEFRSIVIDGTELPANAFMIGQESLTIRQPPAGPFTLEIVTYCNPEANKSLSGLYRSRGIYCTQCEAEGFRRITFSLDRPDVLSVYTTRIEAELADVPILLSNGNLVDQGKIKGTQRHFAVWHDPFPKPSYLFAMVGGDLAVVKDTFKTSSGRKVDLRIYVEPGKEDRCHWAMDSLKRSMRWDEKRFGLEYDLDIFMIVAVSDFNMGAMENKGLNIFNDRLVLASPETATDANFEAIESVIAHEYFHNWTGNRITCRDWFQLCLKEGLTVFRDQEFSADERSATVQRIADVRTLKAHQFAEDAGPLAHPVRPDSYIEINNFYTATVYEKGAELCRMIMTMVGTRGFRKGMDLYFERHDGEAATVEDFIACFADANKRDLSQFLLWYSQSGTPELVCTLKWSQRTQVAELTIEQVLPPTPGQPKKKPQHIPLRLGLIGSNGQDLKLEHEDGTPVRDGLIEVTGPKQIVRFKDITSRPVPSLNRGFSAPINLTIEQSDRDLEFLMMHDSDLYNRWHASQTLATRLTVEMVAAIRSGKRVRRGQKLAKALAVSLADEHLEPAYRAQLIMLPSESDIAREIRTNVDPSAIFEARSSLLRTIGKTIHDELSDVYERFATRGAYRPDAESAGKRSLRNAALALLSATGDDVDIERLSRHYERARNMTDMTAALSLLADIDTPARIQALNDFHDRFKDDLLVMDKWFVCQATSSLPDTVEVVEQLTQHPLFSIQNPNKVRALIGALATANPSVFNRPDGKGYAFIADRVLEIDKFNPQVAARLLGAFRSWRSLEAQRRALARKALRRIAKTPRLSRDVFEIVTKTLDQ